jgi:hypothetical protein
MAFSPWVRRSASQLLIAFALALLLAPANALAQATPVANGCEAPPRSWDDIERLIATPAPPEPERTGTLPWGEQVSGDEAAQIRGTVEQFVACSNAGEPLRVFSLYSDDYLQRLLSRERPMIDSDRYGTLATPLPVDSGAGAVLIEITGARKIMATGQLGALVTIAYPSVPEPKTFFFTFRSIDGALLIDDILGEITFSLP